MLRISPNFSLKALSANTSNKMKEHILELRVRYAETDQMGVVYYSNYLVWFEVARTEFFREKGLDYNCIEKERKIYLPVTEVSCRYKAPLRYDDIFTITTWLGDVGRSRLIFEYAIKKDGLIVTTGYTKHVFIDTKGKPIAMPQDIREVIVA